MTKETTNILNYLLGKVEKIGDQITEIVLADGQRLTWSTKSLPTSVEAGQEIKLILSTEKNEGEVAKTILNEILKNNK